MHQLTWTFDNPATIANQPFTTEGHPWRYAVGSLSALAFNGTNDMVLLDANPLEGAKAFTLEALFYPAVPAPGSPLEQRFFHIQSTTSPDRILLETRLTPALTNWYADTFIRSSGIETFQNDPKLLHPLNAWHTLALVFDGRQMIQYVNATRELSTPIAYTPMGPARTALGARINKLWFFKGSLAQIRITHEPLPPEALLRP